MKCFADNPEPRCACLLILDVSDALSRNSINELSTGLALFRDELVADSLARKRVEVAIVTFGGSVAVLQDFATADAFVVPFLAANGERRGRPIGEAVVTGLNLLEARKTEYRQNGIQYYRPWILVVTAGEPSDVTSEFWRDASERVRKGEEQRKFAFFAAGVEGADMNRLAELSPNRTPLKLKELRLRDLFQWLSNSQHQASISNPPTPDGWAIA